MLHTVTSSGALTRSTERLLSISSPGLIRFSPGRGGAVAADFFVWELPLFVALAACAGVIGAALTHASVRP